MQHLKLISKKEKMRQVRSILASRKLKEYKVRNFRFKNYDEMELDHYKLLSTIVQHRRFSHIIRKICSKYTHTRDNLILSRAQTYMSFKTSSTYFDSKDAIIITINSYCHEYDVSLAERKKLDLFVSRSLDDSRYASLGLFVQAVIQLDLGLKNSFNIDHLCDAIILFNEASLNPKLYEVCTLFNVMIHTVLNDFESALELIDSELVQELVFENIYSRLIEMSAKSNVIKLSNYRKFRAA